MSFDGVTSEDCGPFPKAASVSVIASRFCNTVAEFVVPRPRVSGSSVMKKGRDHAT